MHLTTYHNAPVAQYLGAGGKIDCYPITKRADKQNNLRQTTPEQTVKPFRYSRCL